MNFVIFYDKQNVRKLQKNHQFSPNMFIFTNFDIFFKEILQNLTCKRKKKFRSLEVSKNCIIFDELFYFEFTRCKKFYHKILEKKNTKMFVKIEKLCENCEILQYNFFTMQVCTV